MDGQNVAFDYRYGEGKRDRLSCTCHRAGASQGRYYRGTGGRPTVLAAKNATKIIPIVMASWDRSCPGRFGRKPCASRRQYHRRETFSSELGGKRLELLKEAVPKLLVSRFSTIRPFHAPHST